MEINAMHGGVWEGEVGRLGGGGRGDGEREGRGTDFTPLYTHARVHIKVTQIPDN